MDEKKIVCLFGLFPPPLGDYIVKNSIGPIQFAADALQSSFIEGLSYYQNFTVVNLPFISSYPKYFKKAIIPQCSFSLPFPERVIDGISLQYLNLPGIKLYSKANSAYKALKEHDVDVIIVYSVHSPLLSAAVKYKKKVNHRVKIILIVPDLPEFMSENTNMVRDLIKKLDSLFISKLYYYVDGFILLTEQMRERLPVGDKPYEVIEGIFNPKYSDNTSVLESSEKIIFYAGTLARRYGVLDLIEAFKALNRSDYVLEICGSGDAEDIVVSEARNCPNIRFLGQLSRDKVLEREKRAKMLINPRNPEGEFTKYSFPSKTIEYLGTGIPTVLFKLPGIPNEYYSYCFPVHGTGVQALTDKMQEVLSMNDSELIDFGQKAQLFVRNKKSPQAQCAKMNKLINKVLDEDIVSLNGQD